MIFPRLFAQGLLSLAVILGAQAFPGSFNGAAAIPGSACQLLGAKYPGSTSFPSSAEYANLTSAVWSETCVLYSSCVFEPRNAADVAGALRILLKTQTKFAVRGGGHMPNPGAAGITDGVLISMANMTEMKLSKNKKIAQLGPGLRWEVVYDWISDYNLAVVGGRYGPVGVPGLLLGGGVNYFGPRFGWAANTVANYQVVLANGTIVDANAHSNADLFWALKGGSSNFGIVTQFDLNTFPFKSIFGGITVYNNSNLDQFINATANFCTLRGGSADVYTHVNPSLSYKVADGTFSIYTIIAHSGSETNPASIRDYRQIPRVFDDVSIRTKLDMFTNDTTGAAYTDRSQRQMFKTIGLKGASESVFLSNRTFLDTIAAMPELKNVRGIQLTATHQTITKAWLAAARRSGGDAIDLDPENGNIVAFLISSAWDDEKDDAIIHEFNEKCSAAIEAQAETKNLSYPFKYLNDSPESDPVFKYYGGGKSLPRMQAIARAYDPSGVFQTLMPGGFKVFK